MDCYFAYYVLFIVSFGDSTLCEPKIYHVDYVMDNSNVLLDSRPNREAFVRLAIPERYVHFYKKRPVNYLTEGFGIMKLQKILNPHQTESLVTFIYLRNFIITIKFDNSRDAEEFCHDLSEAIGA